jgi:UDP-glucose 4-epimerase
VTPGSAPVAWVVGGGGLLGANAERAIARRAHVWRPARRFSWGRRVVAAEIAEAADAFGAHTEGRPWWLAWCAGSGVVASSSESLAFETATLRRLLDGLREARRKHAMGPGTVFFSSSAGGLYAGARCPPFDEDTPPQPIAPYGHTKLEQEQVLIDWARAEGVGMLIGRIANLYGPGQDLGKPQGLISQLCRSQITQRPLNIYVPLGTRRDYLYAADCGSMVAAALAELSVLGEPSTMVKVLASQRSMTVGEILGHFRRIIGRRPRVSLRPTGLGRHQVLDLRLSSRVMPDVDGLASTPVPVGLFATFEDLRRRHALGGAERLP